ncbi:MAG: site-specific DNA-methyltransferase [Ruminococcus bromii]|nr:site-specific DNA-methyltransferase [Ruminococcus bromii]
MANLSQIKREKMLAFLEKLKEQHSDDESLIAINQIERELTSKKYGLVWEQHEEEVDVKMRTHIPVFTEDKEREIICNPDNEDFNFLLEGDNLHSLRLLEKTHKGKIDVIYIDPPYNRGKKDFRYDDAYIAEEDTFRNSKWLSFMSERLMLAKRLMTDNGLIFISIDDYEVGPLKVLCDEIFGVENFINIFIWKRNSSGKTEKDKFTVNTEYVVAYSKSYKYELNDVYKPLAESSQKMYNKDDNDGRGKYATVSLQKPRDPGPETTYDYIDNSGKVWPCPPKGWRMKYEKIKALENDGRLYFEGKSLRVKDYWNERKNAGKRIDTLWDDLPENSAASKTFDDIIGIKGLFNNPKPVELISRCISISHKNATVLDFFAGSGTTGQAVLERNKEDGGNRHFILCTNNENNICEEVTYQRLKTVITGKRIDGSEYSKGIPANLKYYKTDFVAKDSEELYDDLLAHIVEMIQLEYGVKVDNKKYVMIMSDKEMDEFEKNIENYTDLKSVFINQDVLLSTSQEQLLNRLDSYIIPDYYFDFELREAGEIW